jgi:hypothetical protein
VTASKTLRFLWRWSLVVTLPVTALFFLWGLRVADRWDTFGLKYAPLGKALSLYAICELEANQMMRAGYLGTLPKRGVPPHPIRRIDIFLSRAEEASLNAELPHSGRKYVKGSLVALDGSVQPVKIKYRGDFHWHWGFFKKSLRIKTKKNDLFGGLRAFNMIAPKSPSWIDQPMAYELARRMDLMAPLSEPAVLYQNGKEKGLYALVEQIEEMTLRRSKRMPGDVFSGEMLGRDMFVGISNRLFEHPGGWGKIAVNNHFDVEANDALALLCEIVQRMPSEQRTTDLRNLIDMDAFARFGAYRALTQSVHFDDTHNWRLYYDPWRNVFEPVVWDPNAWHPTGDRKRGGVQIYMVTSAFDVALVQDQQYVLGVQRTLEETLTSGLLDDFLADMDDWIKRCEPVIRRDPSLVWHGKLIDTDDAVEGMHTFRKKVATTFDRVHAKFLDAGTLRYTLIPSEDAGLSIQLERNGHSAMQRLVIQFDRELTPLVQGQIHWRDDLAAHEADITGSLEVRGDQLHIERPLGCGLLRKADSMVPITRRHTISSAPGSYLLQLAGLPEGAEVIDISGETTTTNHIHGRRVGKLKSNSFSSTYGVVLPSVNPRASTWSGDIEIEGVRHLVGDLILKAGTTVRLAPGASLIIEGRVLAQGTEHSPVQFLPLSESQEPWGTIAIRGPKANGSHFSHCTFIGGSGHKEPLAEYSAMMSVHDVQDVIFENCLLEDSYVVDDMFHAVYSTLMLRKCTFRRSLFDSVDLDICEALVEGCVFEDSGNDSFDLMTTDAVLRNCRILRSKDKGVSVGEGTRALIQSSVIEGCLIGVQIKDTSHAVVMNTDFIRNDHAIDAYKKNWRYGHGGQGFVYKCHFADNGQFAAADKHSGIHVHDTYVSPAPAPSKRVVLQPDVDSGEPRLAVEPKRWIRFPQESAVEVDLFNGYLPRIIAKDRGAPQPKGGTDG